MFQNALCFLTFPQLSPLQQRQSLHGYPQMGWGEAFSAPHATSDHFHAWRPPSPVSVSLSLAPQGACEDMSQPEQTPSQVKGHVSGPRGPGLSCHLTVSWMTQRLALGFGKGCGVGRTPSLFFLWTREHKHPLLKPSLHWEPRLGRRGRTQSNPGALRVRRGVSQSAGRQQGPREPTEPKPSTGPPPGGGGGEHKEQRGDPEPSCPTVFIPCPFVGQVSGCNLTLCSSWTEKLSL